MSSPVGYPQHNAYPMFSSTSQGDVPVGKNGANLIPVMANVTTSSGVETLTAGDTTIPLAAPMLGKSFVGRVQAKNARHGSMRVRRYSENSGFPNMIEAAFQIADGKFIVHRIGKEAADGFIRHHSAFIADKTYGEDTAAGCVNVQVSGAAWSNATGDYPYTTTVGTMVTFSFTGTGCDLRTYTANSGGAWQISVDGTVVNTISTWASGTAEKTHQVVRNLANTEHAVVMTFMGADGVNSPTGSARGWLMWDKTATPTINSLKLKATVLVVNQNDKYTRTLQLASDASNIEAAIKCRKSGSVVPLQMWPNHGGNGSTAIVSQVVYIDGVVSTMDAANWMWSDADRVDVVQTFTVQNPGETAEKLMNGRMHSVLTKSGYSYRLWLDVLQSTEIDAAYSVMSAAYNCDKIEFNNQAGVFDSSAHNDTMYTIPRIADSALIFDDSHPYAWAHDVIDWSTTMRVGMPDYEPQWTRYQSRLEAPRMTKAYNYISDGAGTWQAGERLSISARFSGGVAP